MPRSCRAFRIRFIVLGLIATLFIILSTYLFVTPTTMAQIHLIQLQERIVKIVLGASSPAHRIFYDPQSITINGGTLVKWSNQDNVPHTVTFVTTGIYDSGIIRPTEMVSHSFFNQGVFNYFCIIHPFMTGVITVV